MQQAAYKMGLEIGMNRSVLTINFENPIDVLGRSIKGLRGRK